MSNKSPENTSRWWLRRNARKLITILAAIAVLTVLTKLPERKRDAPPTEPVALNVTVMEVKAEPNLADTIDLPAVVEPNRIVTVSAEIAGRIEVIPMKKGSMVQAGDLLIQLNSDLLQPEFDMARVQVERDQIEFERMENLVKDQATSQRDLDDATVNLAISKAKLDEISARMDRTRIVAPTRGLLNELPVEEGEYVQPDKPVAQLVDIETVKVVVEVPERDIAFFAIGQKAEIFLDVKGRDMSLPGTITYISELAHPQTRSTRMEITLENKERLLRSGQLVRARLTRRTLKDAVFIPLLAVIPMEDSKAVYVANTSEAQRREVELGIIKADQVEVISGLQPGDKLIIVGHRFVAPGQKVNVVSENK